VSSKRFFPGWLIGVLLFVFFGASLAIRITLPWDQVFGGQLVRYTSIDGYYYMRLVDNMVHNFPHYTAFDPFNIFPGGWVVGHLGFFYQLLSGFIWLCGLGHPSQHFIGVAGALFPPFLAALTVVPVYYIGKTLFDRWVGVIAAALMAILPGEYLGRTILGFTDTPVIETLATATCVAFLVLAIKTAAERRLSIDHILKLEWGVFLRPVIYSLLAGLFLGFYMVTWAGGLLFVFIITLYLVAQFIIDHLAGRSTDYLGILGFLVFLVTGIIFLPRSGAPFISVAVVAAILIPVVMTALSRYLLGRQMKPAYYPLAVFGLAVVLIGIVFAISSQTAEMMFAAFRIFAPVGSSATTTMEMQPFLSPSGSFSTAVAWGNYTTSFFLFPPSWSFLRVIPGFAFISFVILVYLYFRHRRDDNLLPLFFIWTVIILVLTLVQRRYSYYLVVNMALLSAWLCWQVVWRYSLRRLQEAPLSSSEETISQKQLATASVARPTREKPRESARPRRRQRHRTGTSPATYRVVSGAVAAAVFLLVFLPNIVKADQVAGTPQFSPSDAWLESLTWMKDNTPEPLGSPGAYDGLYNSSFVYPASAYGVTSWWDYGYWITRIAHRIPSANPSQEAGPIMKVASLFLSRDSTETENITAELKTRYLVADYPTTTTKFWAIATWAGESPGKYLPTYYVQQGNSIAPAQAYSIEYYQTTIVRLYNFGGKAVTQVKPTVVTYTPKVDRNGASYRLATETKQFDSYQAAQDYVNQGGTANRAIVGTNAFISPIPLEAVPGFSLVHDSKQGVNTQGAGSIPEVRIFEYTPP
jgi:oligosaccharyl transferase (archaeosortase A-associated)